MDHGMFRRKYLFGCLGKLRRSQSMHRQNGSWYVPKKILIWMLREATEVSKHARQNGSWYVPKKILIWMLREATEVSMHAQTKWIMVCSEENTYLDA